MNTALASAFPFELRPFCDLSPAMQALVRATASLAAFAPDDPVLTPEMEPTHFYVMATGHVELQVGGAAVAVHGPGDMFGGRAVLAGRTTESWVALEATQAWKIPKATLQTLVANDPAFCTWLFTQVSQRLNRIAQRDEKREFLSLMMARVQDAYVRKPFYVDGQLDLVSVCRLMADAGTTNALVRDGERLGMFTTTDLRDALLRDAPPQQVCVRDVSRFELIAVNADGELFEALLLMLRHRVHRVLVRDGAGVVGVLSQLDLMSFVSNHSHIIALQVEQAESLADLKAAAQQMDGLIQLLHSGGVKVEVISSMVRVLNEQVFAKLWTLVAPPDLRQNSCLVVMGSEGRGEQILKTDQDNALLLRAGYRHPQLGHIAHQFNQALSEFGYPLCPGDIMLTNTLWCADLPTFRQTIRGWLYGELADGPMHLAIFMDAVAVAGDASLLQSAKAAVHEFSADQDAFLARFASAADQFNEPATGWWARLTSRRGRDEPAFDLKKLGTFPVVHGVRALSLEHHVNQVSTAERVQALVRLHVLTAEVARDLMEALHFLMGLKLKHNLQQRQMHQVPSNEVLMSDLSTLERDQLKDSLAIIKRFRQFLAQHYKLEAL